MRKPCDERAPRPDSLERDDELCNEKAVAVCAAWHRRVGSVGGVGRAFVWERTGIGAQGVPVDEDVSEPIEQGGWEKIRCACIRGTVGWRKIEPEKVEFEVLVPRAEVILEEESVPTQVLGQGDPDAVRALILAKNVGAESARGAAAVMSFN